MGRKRVVRIPKVATIRCPYCSKNSRVELDKDRFLGSLICGKCKQKIETPPSSCCVICAFSKKRCPSSLIIEARTKNLEIKEESKRDEAGEKIRLERGTPLLLLDKNILSGDEQNSQDCV